MLIDRQFPPTLRILLVAPPAKPLPLPLDGLVKLPSALLRQQIPDLLADRPQPAERSQEIAAVRSLVVRRRGAERHLVRRGRDAGGWCLHDGVGDQEVAGHDGLEDGEDAGAVFGVCGGWAGDLLDAGGGGLHGGRVHDGVGVDVVGAFDVEAAEGREAAVELAGQG